MLQPTSEQLIADVLAAGRGADAEAVVATARRKLGEEILGEGAGHFVTQPGVRIDLHRDDTVGYRILGLLRALEYLGHVGDPDRGRPHGPRLVRAHRPRLVEADPRDGDERTVVAAEPRVHVLVRRAGLAGQ